MTYDIKAIYWTNIYRYSCSYYKQSSSTTAEIWRMYNKYNCCCSYDWLISFVFIKNSVTCFYFSFSITIFNNSPSMQMLICLSIPCLCFFLSPYRESHTVVNTIVLWFILYFFEYMCDAFNALGLSVSCLYVSFFLFFYYHYLDGCRSSIVLTKILCFVLDHFSSFFMSTKEFTDEVIDAKDDVC